MIWITFPREYAMYLINIHKNVFVLYKAKAHATLFGMFALLRLDKSISA